MTQKHLGEKCGGLFFAELMSFSFAPVQVMYFSSLFPYVVLFCFLVRGLMLKGSVDGIAHMFTPKVRMEESLFLTSVFSTMHANKSLSSHLSWRRCWSRRCGGRPPPRSSLPSVWVLEESLPSPVTIRLTTTATLMPCSSLSSTFWPPFWPHWLCLLCWASRQTSWMKSVLWSKLNTVFLGGGFGNIECNPPKKKQKSDSKVHEYCILTKNHTSKLQSPQSLCYKQWQLSLFSVTYMLMDPHIFRYCGQCTCEQCFRAKRPIFRLFWVLGFWWCFSVRDSIWCQRRGKSPLEDKMILLEVLASYNKCTNLLFQLIWGPDNQGKVENLIKLWCLLFF